MRLCAELLELTAMILITFALIIGSALLVVYLFGKLLGA
jgi:hypothetical protein